MSSQYEFPISFPPIVMESHRLGVKTLGLMFARCSYRSLIPRSESPEDPRTNPSKKTSINLKKRASSARLFYFQLFEGELSSGNRMTAQTAQNRSTGNRMTIYSAHNAKSGQVEDWSGHRLIVW